MVKFISLLAYRWFCYFFLGYLTDIVSKKLLIFVILFGEVPCLLTGFVENYNTFLVKSITRIGIGGIIPITYSLIADYFPVKQRSTIVGYLGLVVGLGIAGGQLLAGMTGPVYGWKICFIIVAVPNFFILLLYILFGTDPQRGRSDLSNSSINLESLKLLLKKTNILVFVQGVAGTVPWAVFVFLVDYLSSDVGFSIQIATIVVSVIDYLQC